MRLSASLGIVRILFFIALCALVTSTCYSLEPWYVEHWELDRTGRINPVPTNSASRPIITSGAHRTEAHWVNVGTARDTPVGGPPEFAENWRIDRWDVEDGLPETQVRALLQTRDGYLWVGTVGGVSRFDGRRFLHFNANNTPAFRETGQDVRAIVEDSKGGLWLALRRGVASFRDGRWRAAYVHAPSDSRGLRHLAVGHDDRVWVASDTGLWELQEGRLSADSVPRGFQGELLNTLALTIAKDGALWIANTNGVFRWDTGRNSLRHVWSSSPVAALITSLTSADQDGAVWGKSTFIIRCWRTSGEQTVALPGSERVTGGVHAGQIATGIGGSVWAALNTDHTLHQLTTNGIQPVLDVHGGPVDQVASVTTDREGNVWVGTRDRGLLRLRPLPVHSLSLNSSPTEFREVRSVAEAQDGSIWCGTHAGALHWSAHRATVFTILPMSNQRGDSPGVLSLYPHDSNGVWVAFRSEGLLALPNALYPDDPQPLFLATRSAQDLGQVRAIYSGPSGRFWIGTKSGLHLRQRDGSWKSISTEHGLVHSDVRAILEDHSGFVWAGTLGGVSRFGPIVEASDHALPHRSWTTQEGLPEKAVHALHEDRHGIVWLGTRRGLGRWNGETLSFLGTAVGLPDDTVTTILEDDQERFWIGCRRGIYRVQRASLIAAMDGTADRVSCVLYGQSDGMPVADTNGESQPAACRASDGRMYFSTPMGLAILDPRTAHDDPQPPTVLVEQVLDGEGPVYGEAEIDSSFRGSPETTRPASPRAERELCLLETAGLGTERHPYLFPRGRGRSLRIRYTATSLSAPERLKFECQLEGLDKSWIEGSPDRVAYYAHLKPGEYRFRVRAANHRGIWNDSGASFSFVVRPMWWEHRWVQILAVATLVLAMTGAFLIRMRWQRKLLMLEQRLAINRERDRIARDMHDEIGAQLSDLVLQIGGTPAQRGLTSREAAGKVRWLLRDLDSLIWSVQPGNSSASDVITHLENFAREYLGRAGLEVVLNLEQTSSIGHLSHDARRHVGACLKEVLRNVVQHAQANRVSLTVASRSECLTIEVFDDGIGFDTNAAASAGGLRNCRDRLAEVGGMLTFDSVPGRGTRVLIEVPLSAPAPS